MLGVITGIYRGTILTRTKSNAAEKAESKALSEARAAVDRQRKGEKAPVLTSKQKRSRDDAMRVIVEADKEIDKRERRSK